MKPRQFYGRLWFRLRRPAVDVSPAPAIRPRSGDWQPPARRLPSLIAPECFKLLNHEGALGEVGWDGPAREKLWRYNQHYFDDLNAVGAKQREAWHHALLSAWVAANLPGQGSGWEPYPASLRIVNWIKWSFAGGALDGRQIHSLAVQARWLRKRLEWHLLGNHLFQNAKALIFAGLFFEGAEARQWLETGMRILERELGEQILADGGQFELSPMYHALALEDVLDLINVLRAHAAALDPRQQDFLARCETLVPPMCAWLSAMSHPDGAIAFFNDAAFDVAPSNPELSDYAALLGFRPGTPNALWLGESGYARLALGQAVLIADMAAVGPDYLPGHAHADSLSFEFSLGQDRIIVNSGTSVYGVGAERLRQRGTAAHSTVTIAGQDSSDVWAGFRVGRRARVEGKQVCRADDGLKAQARHDGYRYLRGRPTHLRQWNLAEQSLRVRDRITPATEQAVARYHLHPAIRVESDGAGGGVLIRPDGAVLRWRASAATTIEPSSWHPRFGESIPTHCIAVDLRDGEAWFELRW